MIATKFTNMFGQVIEPGSAVIMVASGRSGTVKIRQGIYMGLNGKSPAVMWLYKSPWRKGKEQVWRKSTLGSGRVFLLNTPLANPPSK